MRQAIRRSAIPPVPGLRIRVTPKGIKSFAFAYHDKATGKTKWLTLGRYPDVPLATAREIANDARKIAAAGGTPIAPDAGAGCACAKKNGWRSCLC